MKIRTCKDMSALDLAYWERNMLALKYAEGWWNDDVVFHYTESMVEEAKRSGNKLAHHGPRYLGWRRVLSLESGTITFHIPDDFDVGKLPEIMPNWDGHTTEEKWRRVMKDAGVEETP